MCGMTKKFRFRSPRKTGEYSRAFNGTTLSSQPDGMDLLSRKASRRRLQQIHLVKDEVSESFARDRALSARPDIVLIDIRMTNVNGMAAISATRDEFPQA